MLAIGGFVVEGGGSNVQFDRLLRSLPLGGGKGGPQRGETDVDAALRGTRLARGVRHIRVNAETEGGPVLLRHFRVRFGQELNLERTVCFGGDEAMCGLLTGLDLGLPPGIPAPPIGPAHLPHDAIDHLRAVNGRARVAQGAACEQNLVVELRRRLRRVE